MSVGFGMCILSHQMYLIVLNYVFLLYFIYLTIYANYGNTNYMPVFLFLWCITYINTAL